MKTPMHEVCLLLGSNIEPEQNIPRAVLLLKEKLTILQVSSIWESASVDCCYPDFLNMAVLASTSLDANELKEQVLRPLESQMGRVRTEDKNASRQIDFDMILFDGELLDPTLWEHVHQATPVAQLFPDYLSSTGESLNSAARRLAQVTPIQIRTDLSIALP
ncbi:MAG: 2-amino-4-hydroxy-6-hydroxymethyldihydropteridine diphosphokinase [Chloroflexi bacterium RBG_13_48_10]|nr:MAG: 2-amino-4-hydroxy-6-hydroxymethyldihydropteridine diphosphokinase [Chloroflexi bacterium RBG_13_48_10]